VYPSEELLQEVGRVAIAGARLEIRLGRLWWHLDKGGTDELKARRAAVSAQIKEVRGLAATRLEGPLREAVESALTEASNAADMRNNAIHQDWVLRGPAATRPVAELPELGDQADLDRYLEQWDREATNSPDWLRQPARGLNLAPAQTIDDLQKIERRLAAAADRIEALTFAVASARETGHPEGWVRP
jgi:hypothetical protein